MSAPDIRVRLSAEGVKEVLDGIRAVQKQAAEANKTGADGVEGLRKSVEVFKGVLGALGISATIEGIVEIGKSAFETATQMVDTAKKFDLPIEALSRLSFAARENNVSFETLASGADKLQRNISKAITDPASDAAQAFQQLGLSAKDLKGIGLDAQFAQIAGKVSNLRTSEDQLAATESLLGKGTGDLVRLLRQGPDALREFADLADKLGFTLTEKTAKGVDDTELAIRRMKDAISGLATDTVGVLARTFFKPKDELGQLNEEIDATEEKVKALLDASSSPVTSVFGLLSKSYTEDAAKAAAKLDELKEKREAILRAEAAAKAEADKGKTNLPTVETAAQRKAALSAVEQRLQESLKLQTDGIKVAEDAQKRAYDQGLISLAQYYDARRGLIAAGLAAEQKTANQQLAAISATTAKTKDPAEIAQLNAQADKVRGDLADKRLQSQGQLIALEGEEAAQRKQLDHDQVALLNTLDELEGNRHAVFARNLAQESQALQELLTQAGQSQATIDQQKKRLEDARTAQFNTDQASRSGQQTIDAFTRDADQIKRDQEAGIITQLQGEQRLIELERQRLPLLEDIAQRYLAAARSTGDPEVIAKAQQFADSVKEIRASFIGATNDIGKFREAAEEGLQSGLTNLLSNVDKIHGLGDAFKSLALTVSQSLARISAELLAKSLTQGISNLLGLFGASGIATAAAGGSLQKKARGGAIDARGGGMLRGPGSPTSDDLLLLGSRDEFMVRAVAAQQAGAQSFLHAFNTGRITMDDIRAGRLSALGARSLPRFAEGGLVGAELKPSGVAGGAATMRGVLGLEDGLVFRHLASEEGFEVMVKHFQRNPARLRQILGIG